VKISDANSEITTETYDPLGRITSATLPIDQASGDASYKYSYTVTGTSPPVTTTQTLRENDTYAQTVSIYDGMGQLRQVQQTPLDGETGRLISDTFYDSHGWVVKTSEPYYDSSTAPDGTLFQATDAQVPSQTVTTYDGQGRVTQSAFWSLGHKQWATVTAYPGMDETDVTPPAGGTATSSFTNALSQQTASWRYTTAAPDGKPADADITSYTYTSAGQVATVTDNSGNVTSYTYNKLGEKTVQTSPDSGSTSYTYDNAGNLATVTTPRGTIAYSYDPLNRPLGEFVGTTKGTPLAAWVYDSLEKGQLTSSTAYDSQGQQWVEAVTGYNIAYEPTGTQTTVPPDAGTGLTGSTYTTTSTYTPLTGRLNSVQYSADGGLPSETVGFGYDLGGLPVAFGGSTAYLDTATYTPQGQLTRSTYGLSGKQLTETFQYDAGTSRLLTTTNNLQTLSSAADTINYTYNQAGDITSASEAQNTGGTQLQCFTYNNLGQLTTAWTDTKGTTTVAAPSVAGIGGCVTAAPSASTIGGPAPYWQSYTDNLLGDRTGLTIHNTAGITADNVTQSLTYPPPGTGSGTAPADAPAGITTTGPNGSVNTAFGYTVGDGTTSSQANTKTGSSPPAGPPAESGVTYTVQGQVATVTNATTGKSTYTYDAAGNLILQQDPSATTLYLDGGAEQLTLPSGKTTATGLRFYTSPDGTVIVRSSSATISYGTANQQHTATEAVSASTQAITRRYYDPYGNPVGTTPAWPDSNAFLGQPVDTSTQLDLLGARQYDPVTGTFLSPDPLFQPGTLAAGGYTYAGDNPSTDSDPTGAIQVGPPTSSCSTGTEYLEQCGGSGTSAGGGGDPGATSGGSTGSPVRKPWCAQHPAFCGGTDTQLNRELDQPGNNRTWSGLTIGDCGSLDGEIAMLCINMASSSGQTGSQGGSSSGGTSKSLFDSLLWRVLGIGGDITRMAAQAAADGTGEAAGEDVAERLAEAEAEAGIDAKAFEDMAAENDETKEVAEDVADASAELARIGKAFVGQPPDDTLPGVVVQSTTSEISAGAANGANLSVEQTVILAGTVVVVIILKVKQALG
jgi:RHS repeat-associated protein